MVEESEASEESAQQSQPSPNSDPSADANGHDSSLSETVQGNSQIKEAEEDEAAEECGFCAFMKAGPCGAEFSKWEECMEAAEKEGEDVVSRCWPITHTLKLCMEANTDYYGIILEAESAMQQEAQQAASPDSAAANSGSADEMKPAELNPDFSENGKEPIQSHDLGSSAEHSKPDDEEATSKKQTMVM